MSSLVVVGRLGAWALSEREGLFFNPVRGDIDDIGFCGGLDQTISQRPPRPESVPYDDWCSDRFFYVQPDDRLRSIGTVEVRETRVYDQRMRGEIDFTGLIAIVSLQQDAYQAYLDYVGEVGVPALLSDQTAWDGGIRFRIPSRPFAFPMPRGSSSPWETGDAVGRLKSIKRFAFDEIEIQALRDEQGRRVKFDDAAREERSGWQPALSLRGQRSAIDRLIGALRLGRA